MTLKPLRYTISGICLFAGMTAAQAALTITFEQDDATGVLSIVFTGQRTAPVNAPFPHFSHVITFEYAAIFTAIDGSAFYHTFGSHPGELPWTNTYNTPITAIGTGGFDAGQSSPLFYSGTLDGQITWDARITYNGNLAGIGLSGGRSGTIVFADGPDTISVDWSAVVIPLPEPATYALVLGLGVAGVALVRRRRASR